MVYVLRAYVRMCVCVCVCMCVCVCVYVCVDTQSSLTYRRTNVNTKCWRIGFLPSSPVSWWSLDRDQQNNYTNIVTSLHRYNVILSGLVKYSSYTDIHTHTHTNIHTHSCPGTRTPDMIQKVIQNLHNARISSCLY